MIKSWNIWDFPDNLYVLLNKQTHRFFFEKMYQQFRSARNYAKFLGIAQKTERQYYHKRSKKNKKYYIQYIPLWILKKSCKTNKLKKKIGNGIEKIKVRVGNPLDCKRLRLPIQESPALYRIVAHLIGDGFAGKRKVPYYSNTCKELRKQFKKDLQIFGKIKTYERTPCTTTCIMFPKPIANILRYIFNIEFTRPSKLPNKIFLASKKCKSAFLQALFDDEGTIYNNLIIGMSNLNIIKEIKILTESLSLKTGKISIGKSNFGGNCYYFSISEKYIKKFKELISFKHPTKLKRLNIKLKIKERNKMQRTRPLEWTRNKIINLLSQKPMTTTELSNALLLTISGVFYHLRFLENCRKIKRDNYKNVWEVTQGRNHEIS